MNDGMNEFLFNALLICHKECGNKREKKYFFMIPRLQNLHQGSHMIKFLLLSLEKGEWFQSGHWQVCSWSVTKKKCLGNKHVIVMFDDMLFHEPVEASFLWP